MGSSSNKERQRSPARGIIDPKALLEELSKPLGQIPTTGEWAQESRLCKIPKDLLESIINFAICKQKPVDRLCSGDENEMEEDEPLNDTKPKKKPIQVKNVQEDWQKLDIKSLVSRLVALNMVYKPAIKRNEPLFHLMATCKTAYKALHDRVKWKNPADLFKTTVNQYYHLTQFAQSDYYDVSWTAALHFKEDCTFYGTYYSVHSSAYQDTATETPVNGTWTFWAHRYEHKQLKGASFPLM